MKYIFTIFLLFFMSGCSLVTQTNTNFMDTNSFLSVPLSIHETTESQHAIFELELHITGGLGDARIVTNDFTQSAYVSGESLRKISDAVGRDVFDSASRAKVDATIHLVEITEANTSLPIPPDVTYYDVVVEDVSQAIAL